MAWSARCLVALACVFCPPWAQAQPADVPDAVIELWEQHWTLESGGAVVFHERQHVRLNNERAYGEFADPRLTYNQDTDQLEILVARTKRPDGTYRELPEYAHVLVAPNASAGWPAFAGIRQHLLVMSGIEPGCVVELEYRITTKAGARPYLAGDLRLDHRYPVQHRKVTISTPANIPLKVAATGRAKEALTAGSNRAECVLHDLPAAPDEPQSPPWQARCPRLTFTTAGKASQWLKQRHAELEAAADQSELITKLAAEWTKDAKDDQARLRALQEKLAASFNFVEFPVEWRPATVRPASEVLRSNYGLPEEAAAVLLALGRAAGLEVLPGILVSDELWNREVPVDTMVAAYTVLASRRQGEPKVVASGQEEPAYITVTDTGERPEIWEPRHGRVLRDRHWAGCTLLPPPDVILPRVPLPMWADADESRCTMTGKVTLGEDGNYVGTLALRLTGLFVSCDNLGTSDAQKGRISTLAGRLLPDASVESFSVKLLAQSEFEVTAQVKSSKATPKLAERFCLTLPQDAPFLTDVPLPLAHGARRNPVRLTGPFSEEIDLTIEWPQSWRLEDQPSDMTGVAGQWGTVSQTCSRDENTLRLQRATRVTQRELPPADFLRLRAALLELRSEHARAVLINPKPAPPVASSE